MYSDEERIKFCHKQIDKFERYLNTQKLHMEELIIDGTEDESFKKHTESLRTVAMTMEIMKEYIDYKEIDLMMRKGN